MRVGKEVRKELSLTAREKTLQTTLQNVSRYIARKNGTDAPVLRFAGGWVRDKLLGGESHDIDVAIDSMTGKDFYLALEEYLKRSGNEKERNVASLRPMGEIKKDAAKSKHLETATTRIYGLDIDLVNLRKETYAEDSRNPEMEFGTAAEDALRRDATINALFYNLSSETVEDFTSQGLDDLNDGIIRTPLEPLQTFMDDPLRILRCIRFASRFGYLIEDSAEKAMGESSVKESLRVKISRERVLVEVEKMLKGPQPRMAMNLVDKLGLYNTIFTLPNRASVPVVDTMNWKKSYDLLSVFTSKSIPPRHKLISGLLLQDESDSLQLSRSYRAWLLCALLPWARVTPPKAWEAKKMLPPVTALIAREGLMVDNDSLNLIKDACIHFEEIIAQKNEVAEMHDLTVPSKRKQDSLSRSAVGTAIRRWGRNWRSSAMFAMLLERFELSSEECEENLIEDYAKWLRYIQGLDLLNAHDITPIVNGKQLMQALGKSQGGQWLQGPMAMVMEWQLTNPEQIDVDKALGEIVGIIKERRLG